jgi:hypothetical protein
MAVPLLLLEVGMRRIAARSPGKVREQNTVGHLDPRRSKG